MIMINDKLREGAQKYAEQFGSEQLRRARSLNAEMKIALPDANQIISKADKQNKRRAFKLTAVLGAAACAALAFIIPFSLNSNKINNAESELSESAEAVRQADLGGFSSNVIEAKQKLPDGYKFISESLDNGSAVCLIESGSGEIITLMFSSDEGGDYADLNQYDLDGIYAYGAAYPDYSYLTYEEEGVRATLTSEYGLEPLLNLAESISN